MPAPPACGRPASSARRIGGHRLARFCALAILASLACFRGSLPPLELYRLVMPDLTADAGRTSSLVRPLLEGSLAIAPYRAPGIYGDRGIVYRIGETQYGTYPGRQWALPLPVMLGHLTERVLETQPLTRSGAIYAPPSRLGHSYEWQATVREFEEVNRDERVFAAAALDVRLVRTADEVVIWQGGARVEREVTDPTMPNIVRALSDCAAEAVSQVLAQARAALDATPPGVGR